MSEKGYDAEELLRQETGSRVSTPRIARFVGVVAIVWALFQIYVASPFSLSIGFLSFNETEQRSIHLAFALFLAFLLYPVAETPANRSSVPFFDWGLAIAGVVSCLFIVVFYQDIVSRTGGLRDTWELVLSVIGLLLVLEITRRSLGLALVIVACVFAGYAFFGPYMPDLIAHRGVSLNRFVDHMWLTTEGVFGLPLGVSNSFIFLFVLFGALLDKAGAGNYFIQLSFAMLGHLRGGPAKAAVVSSGLTGMISGSAIANIVTTGTFTIPLMKRIGFSGEKAAAIEVSSSINGQIMPPVMGAAAFLMTEFVGISYLEVIKHAFVPAAMSYAALFYVVHLEAVKSDMTVLERRHKATALQRAFGIAATVFGIVSVSLATYYAITFLKFIGGVHAGWLAGGLLVLLFVMSVRVSARMQDLEQDDPDKPLTSVPDALPILVRGLHYILPIGVLIWCLMIERFSASLSVFYAIVAISAIILSQTQLVTLFRGGSVSTAAVGRGFSELLAGMVAGARNMVAVAVAMAAAGIIVGVVSLTGIGLVMSGIIDALSGGNVFAMLVVTALICIVLGMGLPTTANYIVVASIIAQPLVTLAAQNGLEIPLIAVHLFVFYFGLISGTTPPVAVDAFAGAAVAKSRPMETCLQSFYYGLRTAILPFVFVFNPEILLIGLAGFWDAVLVLGMSTLAILVFAAATQGYFLRRSWKIESALLLIASLSLMRPGFWLDIMEPQYSLRDKSEINQIVDEMPDEAKLRILARGETFSGALAEKYVSLPLGTADLAADTRLMDSAGVAFAVNGDVVKVDNLKFNGPAQQAGLDYGWEVLAVEVPNDRISKNWLYIPWLLVVFGIAGLQVAREPGKAGAPRQQGSGLRQRN